jgi:hypothetical protein
MIIDLGATHAFSLDEQKERNILPPQKHLETKATGASGEFNIIRGRVPFFQLGEYQFENVLASFNGEEIGMHSGSGENGNLGMEILRRFHLVIDYNSSRVFLEPNKFFNDPFETNMSGFRYHWNEQDQVVVEDIYNNSSASDADIQPGDLILTINGEAIEKFSYNDLIELFHREGKSLELTIKRGNKVIVKEIKLRRLI